MDTAIYKASAWFGSSHSSRRGNWSKALSKHGKRAGKIGPVMWRVQRLESPVSYDPGLDWLCPGSGLENLRRHRNKSRCANRNERGHHDGKVALRRLARHTSSSVPASEIVKGRSRCKIRRPPRPSPWEPTVVVRPGPTPRNVGEPTQNRAATEDDRAVPGQEHSPSLSSGPGPNAANSFGAASALPVRCLLRFRLYRV